MLRQLSKFSNLGSPIIVSGCMAVVQREDILKVVPNVYFLPPTDISKINTILFEIFDEEFSMENFKFDDASLKVRVDFLDGEVMYGMTNGYSPNRKGFFVFPADKRTNNARVFVISDSTASVKTWK